MSVWAYFFLDLFYIFKLVAKTIWLKSLTTAPPPAAAAAPRPPHLKHVLIPSPIKSRHIQILQNYQHLVAMGTGGQAGGDAAAVVGGEVLVPVRLHLVGPDLPPMGAVCVPAAGMLRLHRELDVFEDDGGPPAALQVHAHDLPVVAPQALDRRACAEGGSPAGLEDEVLLLRSHVTESQHPPLEDAGSGSGQVNM